MSAHKNRYAGWRMYYEGREKSSSFRYFKIRKKCADYTGRRYERAGYPARCGENYREQRRSTY